MSVLGIGLLSMFPVALFLMENPVTYISEEMDMELDLQKKYQDYYVYTKSTHGLDSLVRLKINDNLRLASSTKLRYKIVVVERADRDPSINYVITSINGVPHKYWYWRYWEGSFFEYNMDSPMLNNYKL